MKIEHDGNAFPPRDLSLIRFDLDFLFSTRLRLIPVFFIKIFISTRTSALSSHFPLPSISDRNLFFEISPRWVIKGGLLIDIFSQMAVLQAWNRFLRLLNKDNGKRVLSYLVDNERNNCTEVESFPVKFPTASSYSGTNFHNFHFPNNYAASYEVCAKTVYRDVRRNNVQIRGALLFLWISRLTKDYHCTLRFRSVFPRN